jgi:4,5-dihydroxyphthalate decarboxylase
MTGSDQATPPGGAELELNAGLAFSDRMEALLDGRVGVEGCRLSITCRPPQTLFRAVLKEARYDLSEFSLGSHVAAVGAGRDDYAGLPIFLSRAFRHANIYVRRDAGIARAQDLAGRRIGVADFHQTAAVWVRGLLADDYGVERGDVHWVTGGLAAPVLEDRAPLTLPPGVTVERTSQTLNDLLEAGDIDALISPIAPAAFSSGGRAVRLWTDYRARENDWFTRTGLFPIMHLLVVRRRLLDVHPWLAGALMAAFESARALAAADLSRRDYPKIASPWLQSDREATLQALGRDPWSHGLAPNRGELETLLRYAEADGLTATRLTPEALFHPALEDAHR